MNRRARCSVSQQTQAKNPSQCHKPQAEARNGASRRGSPWPPPRQDEGPRTAKSNSVTLLSQEEVLDDAASTCIVVHERFPALVDAFLEYKRKYGSQYEQTLYANMNYPSLTRRLIEKRPLVFMGPADFTVLRDGSRLGSTENYKERDDVGTDEQGQNRYLKLHEYLSYDEIMLGSLIGVSGQSHFWNDGGRYNQGRPGQQGMFEERGVIIGLVGPRFERPGRMDSVFCLSPERQRALVGTGPEKGMDERLQDIFRKFFEERHEPIFDRDGLDWAMYRARIRLTADILLLEADRRAKAAKRPAHVYVIGLGLGVWSMDQEQPRHFVDAFQHSTIACLAGRKHCIRVIEFAYITVPPATQQAAELTGQRLEPPVMLLFSNRNPAEKLETDDLLVLSYAWDGNAFPGNEYWCGSLSGSGDPAAACMSTISELHNPIVNPGFLDRVEVLKS